MAKEKTALVIPTLKSTDEAKEKALDAALETIRKNHGVGSVMMLGEKPNTNLDVVSTGSLRLDLALGVGGLPRGRVVEIYGPESSGKTTIALHAIASAQAKGGICAFIDAEHAMDPEYAAALGVDIDRLVLSQPDTGEQALQITDELVRSGALSVVVVDSVAALVPRAELEGEMGDSHVGLQARLMGQALRKLTPTVARMNVLTIFINQLREKVGITYGSPETTSGGKALKYYASVRLDVRKTGVVKDGTDINANETRVKVVKNKVAPPLKIAEFQIRFGHGIDRANEIIQMGVEHGFIKKSGAWYSTSVPDANGELGEVKGQGQEGFREVLLNTPNALSYLEGLIVEAVSG
jgi:recombination protein RecA